MSLQPWSAGFRMGRHPWLLLVAAVMFAVVAAMMPKPVRNRIDDWLAGFRRHDTTWPGM
jgi:predicted DCC family thiol-disulfide oxidoreductase YuxK